MPAPSRNEIYDAVIRKMVNQALADQEEAFARDHGEDTDSELLRYLQQQAARLGHSPGYKEVVGWQLVEQRFGSWKDALHQAGLPPAAKCPVTKLPRIQAETERQKQIYRQKKAEKKLKNLQRLQEQERRKKENA